MGKELSINIDYTQWFSDLKKTIKSAQIKAALQVNSELLRLYWSLGKDIVEMQKSSEWGDSFLQKLSKDLSKEIPDMNGLSHRNLKSIRQWYLFYTQFDINGKQVVSQIESIFFSIPCKLANSFRSFTNWKELKYFLQ